VATSWTGIHMLVADGAPIVYAGVAAVAAGTDWISAVTYAGTGRDAIETAETTRPGLVLLNPHLPDMPAAEILRELRIRAPQAKVVFFAEQLSRSILDLVDEAGPDGVVHKNAGSTELLATLRRVQRGERVVARQDTPGGRRDRAPYGLTSREHAVLRRVALGETNAEIASVLGLTSNTVKTYLQRALQKLGARNRVEALNAATQLGLL
jgi:two-component system, NarL family, nitrate/nitrite response regulator NarL